MARLRHEGEVHLRATSPARALEQDADARRTDSGARTDSGTATVVPARGTNRRFRPQGGEPSFRGPPPTTHYLPQVVVATCLVALLPLAVVWYLRARGAIDSAWVGIPLAVVLSLLASLAGSAYWQRRRSSGDLMFSELLLWGWLRRLYLDHQVSNARKRLGLGRDGESTRRPQADESDRLRLLRQLAVALDGQDAYTDSHSRRVARHATMTARKLGLSREEVSTIQLAALVHDVGKLHVPRQVLNKPSKLSAAEFQIVKRHPEQGADMVDRVRNPEVAAIVRHHHERLDGSGYPDGLRGVEIPLGARIVAVADMFDAITAPRPYRPARPHRKAFETLTKEAGTHLDPEVVDAFRSCYSGRGPLAWWMGLLALLDGLAWPRAANAAGVRPSLHGVLSTAATTLAVAAIAVAAPIARHEHTAPRQLSAAPAPAIPAARIPPRHVARAPAAHHPPRKAPPLLKLAGSRHIRTPTTPHRGHVTPARALAPATPATPRPAPTSASPTKPGPPSKTPSTPTSAVPSPSAPAPVAPPATAQGAPASTVTTSSPATTTTTTTTTTPSVMPNSKDQCRNGGYAQYGFANQGQCIAFVEHQN